MKQWLNPLSVTQGWAAQVPVPWPFWENGALSLQEGVIANTKVIVKDCGVLNVSNSSINLRNNKELRIDKGGKLIITSGRIE